MNKNYKRAMVVALVVMAVLLLYATRVTERRPSPVTLESPENGNFDPPEAVNPRARQEEVPSAPAREEGEKGLEISLIDLGGFQAGDELDLFIPQEGTSYRGRISTVEMTSSGNRVLSGKFEGGHRFIFTVGQFQTFGSVQTDKGRYQLETRDGNGRIISLSAINRKLDFSKPDYVISRHTDQPPQGE